MKNCTFSVKTALATSWANFAKMGNFFSTSGHTGCGHMSFNQMFENTSLNKSLFRFSSLNRYKAIEGEIIDLILL